jgi:fructose-1,6-bisphosphatase/inositol monophosphatase family enzyme
LCSIGEEIVHEGIEWLHKCYGVVRNRFLEHSTSDVTQKKRLVADIDVETDYEVKLQTRRNSRFESIRFFGEENLDRKHLINLESEENTCVLVDALDGSDLYERGIGNWCSAVIFYTPQNPVKNRIRAAIVGLSTGEIYVADDDLSAEVMVTMPAEFKYRKDEDNWNRIIAEVKPGERRKLRGRSDVKKLVDASICFYGQKINNLVKTVRHPGWNSNRFETPENNRLVPRVYNLAGIPMILKLVDKPSKSGSGIDLVMELEGQQPHDVIPGAFIAKRAGAAVVDLANNEITYENLGNALLKPNADRLQYIIASTPELASEAVQNFSRELSSNVDKKS